MEEQIDNRKLVEAALFMSPKPVSIAELSELTGVASPGIVEKLVRELAEDYKNRDTVLEIAELGGKYVFSLKSPYSSKVKGVGAGPDLSRGALRILAYISKNENMLQSQLVNYFGSSTYDYMKELEEKEFVETKKFKRSKRISTTQKFKEYFNV